MTPHPSSRDDFHTTRWSLIRDLNAGESDTRGQLNALCLRYWAPIHQYIRRSGRSEGEARDLTQAFLTHLFQEGLARAGRYSRFRDFLAGELDDFLARNNAAQAGDRRLPPLSPVCVDVATDAPTGTPTLERSFALEVMSQSMARLRAEAVDAGHPEMFERLQRYLSADAGSEDIAREAEALDAKPLFVSMAIRRLRQRFRRIVDDELTQLVTDPAQLAEERAAMLAALGRET
ncbi:MAG: hypothetical protein M3485_06355 [Pseudomonadota bacterium]|nr:hypothetical protein [Pseudomonadota bacterium]